MAAQRVLLVADDPSIGECVRLGLADEGFDVAVATSGDDALAQLQTLTPDLLVLDLLQAGRDSAQFLAEARRHGDLPMIMLRAHDEVADPTPRRDARADGHPEPLRLEQLLARIRAVVGHTTGAPGALLRAGDVVLDAAARTVTRDGVPVALTAREFDLLRLLMANRERVLTRDVLLEHVWGRGFAGESNVIEVHVSNLRRKLEAHGPRVIHTLRGVGYVFGR